MEHSMNLKKSKSLLDAIRISSNLNYLELAEKLRMPYQTTRRMCQSSGTPRLDTLKKLVLTYPGITDNLWRKFSYILEVADDIDFESSACSLIALAKQRQELPELALNTTRRAKAVSFYLHEEQISELCLLSSILGKSQSQIIREHIYELSSIYLSDSKIILEDHDIQDEDFNEPSDAIVPLPSTEDLDATLDILLDSDND